MEDAPPGPSPASPEPLRAEPMSTATFVHDLRQSLFAIHMAVRLLERSRGNETQFKDLCRSIEEERQKASDLLARLLDEAEAREKT